jgi:hypothetical protein
VRGTQRSVCPLHPSIKPDAVARSGRHTVKAIVQDTCVYAAGDAAGLSGDGRECVCVHQLRRSFVAVDAG